MSSVLVFITIPERSHESEIRCRESKIYTKSLSATNVKNLKFNLKQNNNNNNNNVNNSSLEKVNNYDNYSKQDYKTIEEIVENGLAYLGIVNATWTKTKDDRYIQILFAVDMECSDAVIQYFKSLGIGLRWDTSIGIVPFSLFYYNGELNEPTVVEHHENNGKPVHRTLSQFKQQQSKFLKSITARLTVAQVVSNVKTNAEITFDFCMYVIFACCIAAMGLLDNSVVSLVASMLVSPMMGPLMALTFGTCIKDRLLIRMGLRNVAITFAFCIVCGFTIGMIALNFMDSWNSVGPWPTNMMQERGLLRVLWIGTLVAFPSGCAVAISMLSANEAGLVGVAISVSLLPPCVNGGLLFAFSVLRQIWSINQNPIWFESTFTNTSILLKPGLQPQFGYKPVYNDNMSIETFILGLVSLMFSLVNIINIFLGAMLLLKIKEIASFTNMSPEKKRFFQEDIKIVREYNEKTFDSNHRSSAGLDGEEVLREWATIVGLDSENFLSPESRTMQMQTLADIARDVEADIVYQTVSKNLPNSGGYATRRLSQSLWKNVTNNRRASHAASTTPSCQIPPPLLTVSNFENKSESRRRISIAPLSASSILGRNNPAFTFSDTDIAAASDYEKRRRCSSALLRKTLQNTEHSPYSMWPSTRISASPDGSKFTVVPVVEAIDEYQKSVSMSNLNNI